MFRDKNYFELNNKLDGRVLTEVTYWSQSCLRHNCVKQNSKNKLWICNIKVKYMTVIVFRQGEGEEKLVMKRKSLKFGKSSKSCHSQMT